MYLRLGTLTLGLELDLLHSFTLTTIIMVLRTPETEKLFSIGIVPLVAQRG